MFALLHTVVPLVFCLVAMVVPMVGIRFIARGEL